MTDLSKIFKYQLWHLLSLSALIAVIYLYISHNPEILIGSFWQINTQFWFWLAIAIPVIHQSYVFFIWRFELYRRTFSKWLGVKKAFTYYAVIFCFLFLSRLISIVLLSVSNRNSLNLDPAIAYILVALITPFVMYTGYSVRKYFTISRAFGIDHFDPGYHELFVKKGIFKYTDNGMYIFGLMILYLPGLLILSEAAILLAVFNHIYIWVHYCFTERPDMVKIYGYTPK